MEIKMAKELSSRINPAEYEKSIYKFWLDKKLFHADEYSKKPAYSIVIPPPNVTRKITYGTCSCYDTSRHIN